MWGGRAAMSSAAVARERRARVARIGRAFPGGAPPRLDSPRGLAGQTIGLVGRGACRRRVRAGGAALLASVGSVSREPRPLRIKLEKLSGQLVRGNRLADWRRNPNSRAGWSRGDLGASLVARMEAR